MRIGSDKRFKVLYYREISFEVIDDKTNEMIERFSTFDPKGDKGHYSAAEVRKQAYDLARRLNKGEVKVVKL